MSKCFRMACFAKVSQKGFLSFFIVIVFALLFVQHMRLAAEVNEFSLAEKSLIEVEKANFLRTELETNFDNFVKEFLSNSLAPGKAQANILQQNFASSLNNDFIQAVESRKNNIKFHICNCGKNDYKQILEKTHSKPDKGDLQNLFKIVFDEFQQNKISLKFVEKSVPKTLFAEILFPGHKDAFIVPLDYFAEAKN